MLRSGSALRNTIRRNLTARNQTRNLGGVTRVPDIINEPILTFEEGSWELKETLKAVEDIKSKVEDIPCVVGGKEIRTGNTREQVIPHEHSKVIAKYHLADQAVLEEAKQTSLEAQKKWAELPYHHRISVFLKAADRLSTDWRGKINASTMLGQSKTFVQAEIDAACETIDFFRFNCKYAADLYETQVEDNSFSNWNRTLYRPLEGFVAAISPFNFTAIGGNLCGTPALMGNVVLWKPSDTAMLSNYYLFQLLRECGLPDGVINFVPTDGPEFGKFILQQPELAGINFTGSTKTFQYLWQEVGNNLKTFKTYPRVVGETGGKNFHLVHPTADFESVINGTIRSAFEYQGQKCSACSRIYVPKGMWENFKNRMIEESQKIVQGPAESTDSFMSAVIDETSFNKIKGYLDDVKNDDTCETIVGGTYDASQGYYIHPTIIRTTDKNHRLLKDELFGPVLTCYVYDENEFAETVDLVDQTSEYGLTGAFYCRDRYIIEETMSKLRHAAGNFYINDKSTGSVVGQQPFGGARASGTNDKAGGPHYVSKWVSTQSIKETFVPSTTWRYPYMTK